VESTVSPAAKLWQQVSEIDNTLRIKRGEAGRRLLQKRLRRLSYTRHRLFTRMAMGRASVFTGFPVPVRHRPNQTAWDAAVTAIRTGFPPSARAHLQTGPARTRVTCAVPEVMKRWERGQAVLGVTDLHLRGTRFDRSVNTRPLSSFNLLLECSGEASRLEMMTLVISTFGNITDSHTDDSDGSNHCFVGKKFWLVWDRLEGQRRGLQDASHDLVTDSAEFDLTTFASLESARWFVVSDGDTLFLPGNLAHKVVTLAPYLGLGSFYLSLPSAAATITRWCLDEPRDVTDDLIDEACDAIVRKMRNLEAARPNERDRWGADYFWLGVSSHTRLSERAAGLIKRLDS
jgi:hypothetical protein